MGAKSSGEKVLKTLTKAGYAAYFVGGMVRDTLLSKASFDIDITTDATPDEVLTLFEKTIATGLQHGTVTVVIDGKNIEVTTFRLDGDYLDNRHPDGVTFTHSLLADLARRDFTINAMAQTIDRTIYDPFNGKTDLKEKIIRSVGDPKQRFEEDALRILRGIRFVAKLGFDIEEKTLEAMKACHELLKNLSIERIRKEFEGIIAGEYRTKALKIMCDYELFDYIPFFHSFHDISDDEIKRLDDFRLIIILLEEWSRIGYIEEKFLEKFPVTREEKKLIKDIYASFDELQMIDNYEFREEVCWDKLTQYYFGVETLQILMKYRNFDDANYNRQDVFHVPFDLPIYSRNDLAIQPKEVIQLSKKVPGSWINQLFTELERAVLLEEIGNNHKELFAFIKERGIFNVEKT